MYTELDPSTAYARRIKRMPSGLNFDEPHFDGDGGYAESMGFEEKFGGGGKQLSFPQDLNSPTFELGHAIIFGFLVDKRAAPTNPTMSGALGSLTNIPSSNKSYSLSPNLGKAVEMAKKEFLTDNQMNPKPDTGKAVGGGLKRSLTGNNMKMTDSTIAMYMPAVPQAQYQHEYKTESITALGAALAGSAEEATGAAINFFKAFASIPSAGSLRIGTPGNRGKFLTEMGNFWDNTKKIGNNLMGGAGEGMLTESINALGSGVISATMRQVTNPRLEMLYQATSPRTFTYTFKMNPSSEDESDTIQQIIRMFKIASHPSVKQNTKEYVLRYPTELTIKYMSYGKENRYINKIHDCICTNVTVDYNTEGSFQAHRPTAKGAPPATVTLGLTFQETEMLTADLIAKGGY